MTGKKKSFSNMKMKMNVKVIIYEQMNVNIFWSEEQTQNQYHPNLYLHTSGAQDFAHKVLNLNLRLSCPWILRICWVGDICVLMVVVRYLALGISLPIPTLLETRSFILLCLLVYRFSSRSSLACSLFVPLYGWSRLGGSYEILLRVGFILHP